jgi:hypothetical protein
VVSFTPLPLYPEGKSPWYLFDRKVGGLQSRSGRGDERNSQPFPGLESPIIQPVAHRNLGHRDKTTALNISCVFITSSKISCDLPTVEDICNLELKTEGNLFSTLKSAQNAFNEPGELSQQ